MIAASKGFTRWAGLILAVSLPLISTQAHAVTVTVGQTSYELGSVTGSFDSINLTNPSLLQSQTWWGDSNLALQFANALNPSDITWSPNFGLFAYSTSGGNINVWVRSNSVFSTSAPLNTGGPFMTATASASSVPEINAGSLSQAMLILFALWLVTRRGSASRVA